MTPKGKLMIVGGHEDKGEAAGASLDIDTKMSSKSHFEILGTLIAKTPRTHHIIEIIASASSAPAEMEAAYVESYKKAGFTQVGTIRVENEEDTRDAVFIKRIQNAHAVFFTGGDQEQLVARLGQTDLLAAIIRKYYADSHFIIGGTSAGAMAMPETIIGGGIIGSALYKGDIRTGRGFGVISGVIIDTHFIKRGRFARLANAVTQHPSCLGIGLEEDTALIISGGDRAECIGSGMVILIDGGHISSTNIDSVDDRTPVVVENLSVSIIAEGSCYSLKERRILAETH